MQIDKLLCTPRLSAYNKIEDIEILGLTFKYPGSERSVLNNINLSIKKGEKIAIVGNNGAGKTTLINIILGLYTKYTGNILMDNTEFGKIGLISYNKRVSAILQDFIRYNYSLNENIIMGDVSNKDNYYGIVEEIISQVGLSKKVEKLKYGVNTRLSKEYEGGEDLSGGEWQKLAIARAMIKDSDLIVLDEPTSALDPIAELEIFDLFNKISQVRQLL
ncbi:ATP-binding cassette domain-containing protein [Ruminiclostridium cellulolyticum]|uniref:ATP-binding cassette domain-containing protein n=1 Tax=Ruminiclostridium cellulolyticum TaxID=1521 RepID=UPI0009D69C8B